MVAKEGVFMTIELKGYYKLPHITEPQLIDFNLVFHKSFMRKYTAYKTFDKFLAAGKFGIKDQADFEALPEKKMDIHVKKSSRFSTWQEMLDFATDKYILQQGLPSPLFKQDALAPVLKPNK